MFVELLLRGVCGVVTAGKETSGLDVAGDQFSQFSIVADITPEHGLTGEKSRLRSSYEKGCQEKTPSPAPREDAGVATDIQPHLILRGVSGLVALARRTF